MARFHGTNGKLQTDEVTRDLLKITGHSAHNGTSKVTYRSRSKYCLFLEKDEIHDIVVLCQLLKGPHIYIRVIQNYD